jgi:dTDP-4-amino-4,6-dideoxygalactose transaminase
MTTPHTKRFLPFAVPDIGDQEIDEVADTLRSGWLTTGERASHFEQQFKDYAGAPHALALNSGTGALHVALAALAIGPGDEVITTPLTWIATANVILAVGAQPVFVDVDPVSRNMDLDRLETAVTPRTRAIIPVDMAGLPVDRDRLYAIAGAQKLRVIEDAAQSIGSQWNGRPIGTSFGNGGDFVSFSFHANKNITTGEGGALVLPEDIDPKRCERLRLQGVQRFPDGGMDVEAWGGKWNLTDIAATIGLGQLRHLEEFTARRRHLARRYLELLDDFLGLGLPVADFANSNWHMFQVLLPAGMDRGRFVAGMKEKGIGVGVHYPALHLFSLFRRLGFKAGDFPHAERIGREIVTLPLFPAMTDADVDRVCAAIAENLKKK